MYEAIIDLQWHPFMLDRQGHYRNCPKVGYLPLKELITEVGQSWVGEVRCFKTHSINCTLLAQWDYGYSEPWLIVTDLAPQKANICWYSMRSWIECLFKDIKSGGMGWHHTKMTDPSRAERLWLAIAVATLWLVIVGGKAQANISASSITNPNHQPVEQPNCSQTNNSNTHSSNNLSQIEPPIPTSTNHCSQEPVTSHQADFQTNGNLLSCFRRGFLKLLATLIKGLPLPTGPTIFSPAPG